MNFVAHEFLHPNMRIVFGMNMGESFPLKLLMLKIYRKMIRDFVPSKSKGK
jgi:hypothetical protein